MGQTHKPVPTIFCFALLFPDAEIKEQALDRMKQAFGGLAEKSEIRPFDFTRYYEKEMGTGLMRQYFAVAGIFGQGKIAGAKLRTNAIEEDLSGPDGRRRVNIDPAYMTLAKLVVPTTKDATYRIYISDGIYAQPMLHYKDDSFRPWQWTYTDYKQDYAVEFFNRVRQRLKG